MYKKSFNAALDNVKVIAADPAASQKTVDEAVTSVCASMKGLVAVDKGTTNTPGTDKTEGIQTG